MYPTLSYLIKDVFGVQINLPFPTFGFMVALAFLSAAWLLTLELKRKEKDGLLNPVKTKVLVGKPASYTELLTNAIVGFIIGFKFLGIILQYEIFSKSPQHYILSAQGSWIGGIVLAAGFVYNKYREKEKQKRETPEWVERVIKPHELVGNIVIIAAIAGILGAKIFDNLDHIHEFIAHPIDSMLSFSGLAIYGGLILGGAAVIWYAVKKGIHPIHLCDAAAPALMIAYGVGRIGCQLSGDGDWGIVNHWAMPKFLRFLPHWMWSFNYPHNVIREGILIPGCQGNYCYMLAHGVFPTPFYETVSSFIFVIILWSIRKKIKTPGIIFSIYLMMNGFERFLIEHIRINVPYHFLGIVATQAEIISPILFLLGLIGIFYFRKHDFSAKKAKSEP